MRLFVSKNAASFAAMAALALFLPVPASSAVPDDEGPGVYLMLVEGADLAFDEAVSVLEDRLIRDGWTIATAVDCGVDETACSFRSRVVVAYADDYVDQVMAYGTHAAYAVPIRFVVWEDENGVNVGATNPMNLNRTIVDEETSPEDWAGIAARIRSITLLAFPGFAASGDYGQHRKNARIGRTMGIMAGGKFVDKIEQIATLADPDLTTKAVAEKIVSDMPGVAGDWEWQAEPAYLIDLPSYEATLVGVRGPPIEARSFGIVRHGGNDARKEMACPGIDHAAAFPIEILVSKNGDAIEVSLVDEMYRMKMFFEDAGKMSFAKNMGMPGSIEDEIKKKIQAIVN